jgi:hypothetical protein
MAKDSPAAPAAPDPSAVAGAQSASNVDTAIAQAALNNTNQVTPFGSLTFDQTGSTDVNGQSVPQFTATTTLSPDQQEALNSEQSLTQSLFDLANNQTGRIDQAVNQPFDMSSVPALPTDPTQIDQNATNQVYQGQLALLQPELDQQKQQMEDQLVQQGITPGQDANNTAWNNAEGNFQRNEDATLSNVAGQSVGEGAALGAQEFNEGTQANQNAVQEQEFLRELPLNEAIALMGGGQIQNPTFSSTPSETVAPTDVLGAFGLQQNAENQAFQGQLATQNSNTGAAAGLGGAAIGAAALALF